MVPKQRAYRLLLGGGIATILCLVLVHVSLTATTPTTAAGGVLSGGRPHQRELGLALTAAAAEPWLRLAPCPKLFAASVARARGWLHLHRFAQHAVLFQLSCQTLLVGHPSNAADSASVVAASLPSCGCRD